MRSAELLTSRHPDLARRLDVSDGFRRVDGALSSRLWRTPSANPDRLGAALPDTADGAVHLRLGASASHALTVHLDATRPAPAALDNGRVVYADAYRSSDAILASTPFRLDAMLLLRAEDAPRSFAFGVDLPDGVTGVEREPSLGSWLFHDARHAGVVRALQPSVVDARGARRDAEIGWNGRQLTVTLDTSGLLFPVLFDLPIEAALWQQRCTDDACKANQPTPRSRVAMAYDSDKSAVLTFGGWGGNGNGLVDSKTWSWDGLKWTLRTDGVPSARSRHMMIDDEAGQQVMMFGGSTLENLTDDRGWTNETWIWSGRWAQFTGASPPPLMGLGLAYDRKAGQGVLFGGVTTASLSDAGADDAGPTIVVRHSRDTWIWDGRGGGSWKNAGVAPSASPPPRRFFGMAYDEARDETVIFGGEVQFESDYFNGKYGRWNDTWVWKNGAWTQKTPAHSPSPRGTAYMAYDARRKVTVLFGGYGTSADPPICPPCDFYGDTWEWDGTDWTQIEVTGPSARNSQGIAYDPVRNRTVLFGGYVGSTDAPANDVWEYAPPLAAGTCEVDADCASTTGHCVDGVCCAQASCGECAKCNDPASVGTCAPVSDGTTCGGGVCKAGTCGGDAGIGPNGASGGSSGSCALGPKDDASPGGAALGLLGLGVALGGLRHARRRR